MIKKLQPIFLIFFSLFLIQCDYFPQSPKTEETTGDIKVLIDTLIETRNDTVIVDTIENLSEIEKVFINAGLIDIKDIDSTFLVDLKYASTDNFVGINLYGDLKKAYLQKEVAEKLVDAHRLLNYNQPGYRFLIYDATRPRSIQQMMWDSVKIPSSQRSRYLSDPKYGSMHNFGAAVDLTVIDSAGVILDMGTEFDSFEELAYPRLEDQMLKSGKLTEKQYENRHILRDAMTQAGFNYISTEWWHFSSCSKKEARIKYAVLESHLLPKESLLIAEAIDNEIDEDLISITFKVQIKTSTKPLSLASKKFKKVKVTRYYHKGLYKYTTGEFKDLENAYILRNKMRDLGFKDCFIAGFNNDKRISIKDAIELSQ